MNEDETLAMGLKKEKKGFSLVWIAPIIALIITSGMIYKSYMNAGTRITIVVDSGDGVKNGKTQIMYKGISIGMVEDIHIKEDDVSKLELVALINKSAAAGVAREGNMFWLVRPKISLTEVSGLDTIIGGIYIAVMPAKKTREELYKLPFQDHFIALQSAPVDIFNPGFAIRVHTVNKGDIAVGAPVLYQKQTIGKIEDKKLSKDRSQIDLILRIEGQYVDLIHEESIFYKVDGVEVKANLSGIKVNMGSFASFIAGGIGLYNSKEAIDSKTPKEYQSYSLYDNYDDIMLSDDEIVLSMNEQYNFTADITKIFYKGVEVGLVKDIGYHPKTNVTKIKVKLNKDFRPYANDKAYFWVVSPRVSFDKIEGLDTIVRGNYINFSSSDLKAELKSSFTLHDKKPKEQGLNLSLIAQDIQSLKEGAGVFYHSIEIGLIDSYVLNKDNKTFTIKLIIQPKYAKLLNSSSSFYHHSGVSFEASLSKVAIETGSLETMLKGGISVVTPNFKASKRLKKKYTLHENHKQMIRAQYLAANGIYLKLIAKKAGSLKEGSPILYKQIKVGEVLSSKWDSKTQQLHIKAFVIEEYAQEVHANTLFYNASGLRAKIGLDGLEIDTESIETIISGGISFFTPSNVNLKSAHKDDEFVLYDTKDEAVNTYFEINILADDSYGLKVGSTLKYKNVLLGQVESIELKDKNVLIKVQIDTKYKSFIKEDTLFWLEGFEIGLSGVKNAASALTGPVITIMPGQSKQASCDFELSTSKPLPHFQEKGLRIVLQSARLSGIKANTPVFFRQVKIGSVVQYTLNENATGLDIEVFVEPCFSHLVRKNSYFFNASGIGMEVSLFGAKVKTESIESILTGGIGILTPDDYNEVAQNKDAFILNETFDEDALEWSPKLQSTNEACH